MRVVILPTAVFILPRVPPVYAIIARVAFCDNCLRSWSRSQESGAKNRIPESISGVGSQELGVEEKNGKESRKGEMGIEASER